MKVHVGDNIYIESDERQFVIKQYKGATDKDGNEVYKTLGYFGSLKAAIKKLVTIEVMKSEAKTLKELLVDIKQIESKIDELIRV